MKRRDLLTASSLRSVDLFLLVEHVKSESVPLLHKEGNLEINTFVVAISCFFAANDVTDSVSFCVNVFLSRMLLINKDLKSIFTSIRLFLCLLVFFVVVF